MGRKLNMKNMILKQIVSTAAGVALLPISGGILLLAFIIILLGNIGKGFIKTFKDMRAWIR